MSAVIYTFADIQSIYSQGFNYKMQPEMLQALQILNDRHNISTVVHNRYRGVIMDLEEKQPAVQQQAPVRGGSQQQQQQGVAKWAKKGGHQGGAVEVSPADWEALTNFQTTKLEQKTGSAALVGVLRGHINKLTKDNYPSLISKIKGVVEQLMADGQLAEVADAVFDIASNNSFYSEIYAQMYNDLLKLAPDLLPQFHKKVELYTDMFSDLKYCDPDEDYDQFCEMNRRNDRRRAVSSFLVNMSLLRIVKRKTIIRLMRMLMDKIDELLDFDDLAEDAADGGVQNPTEVINELVANLGCLYHSEIVKKGGGEEIVERMQTLSCKSRNDHRNLSSRAIFKLSEILEK